MEFHIHIDASNIVVDVMLTQNLIKKYDQLILCIYRLLNSFDRIYNSTKIEAFVMVYTLKKNKYYLIDNKFIFFIDRMILIYLIKNLMYIVKLQDGF